MNVQPSCTYYVSPGQVILKKNNALIISTPLGSCIAFIAYHKKSKTGGMAHIMLPGHAPQDKNEDQNKYAANAINSLLAEFRRMNIPYDQLQVCLIGGANVLRKKNDTLVRSIISCVENEIAKNNLHVKGRSLGGFERHGATLDLAQEKVYFSIGNQHKEILCDLLD